MRVIRQKVRELCPAIYKLYASFCKKEIGKEYPIVAFVFGLWAATKTDLSHSLRLPVELLNRYSVYQEAIKVMIIASFFTSLFAGCFCVPRRFSAREVTIFHSGLLTVLSIELSSFCSWAENLASFLFAQLSSMAILLVISWTKKDQE